MIDLSSTELDGFLNPENIKQAAQAEKERMQQHKLLQGDCVKWLDHIDNGISTIFADPPDNINLGYNDYDDRLPDDEYIELLGKWLRLFCEKADTVWISFNSRWLLDLAATAKSLRDCGYLFTDCVQTFSFYQANKHDMGNAHRPLWRFRKPNAPIYPDQAKIPSWRQQNGDSRAKAGGKVPGTAFDFTKVSEKQRRDWHERAIQCGGWVVDYAIPDDHFDFTRVVGNSKQRRPFHPTQLNEGLVKRCLQLSSTTDDWVVDPFGGTGTTLRVCKELGDRNCTLIELDKGYCAEIAKEHDLEIQQLCSN